MLRISKTINNAMVPYIYHSKTFHFGLTGFTNFLWQSGPFHRHQVQRLAFHFGKIALLHCIRWLAPDEVFELLEPPVVTNPRSLQYFWRCQIRELAREVDLLCLTVDLRGMPKEDIPMVDRILRSVFGSVKRIKFVETDGFGTSKEVGGEDERIQGLNDTSWRELCRGYFERHRRHHYFFSMDLMRKGEAELERMMDENRAFFDQ
jgi:hypothetical protein